MPNLSDKYKRGQHLKPGRNNLSLDDIALKLRNRQTRSNSRSKNVPPLPESSSKILTVIEASDHDEHKVDNKMLNHETDNHDLVSINRKRSLRFSKNDSSIDHHSIQSKNSDRLTESGNSVQKHKSSCKNLNMKNENELNKLQGSSDKDKQLLLPENSGKSDAVLKPCLVFLTRCTADKPALQPVQMSPNINGTEGSEKSNAESSKKYSFHSKNLPHNYGSLSNIDSGKKFAEESLEKIERALTQNTCETESGEKANPICPKKKYPLRSKISSDKSYSVSDINLGKEFLKEMPDGVECDSKQNTSDENGEKSKTESHEKVDYSVSISKIDSKRGEFTKESFDKVECASRESTTEDESAGKSNPVCPKKKYSLRSKISSDTSHPLSDISLGKEFLKESFDGIECDSKENTSDVSGEKSKTVSQKQDDNSTFLLDIDFGRKISEESLDKVDCASRQNSCENETGGKTNTVCSKKKYPLRSKISPDKSHSLSDINLGKEFSKESLDRVECDSEQNASDETGEKLKTVSQKNDDNSLSDIDSGRFSELSLDKAECVSRQNTCENEISEKSNPICSKKKYPLRSEISPDKSHSVSDISLGKEFSKESLDRVECDSEQNASDETGEKSNPVSSKRKYSFHSTHSSNKSYSLSDIGSINKISQDLLDGVECDLKQIASENESGEKSNMVSRKNNNSFCSENVSDNSPLSEIESRKRDFSKCGSSDSNSENESFEKSYIVSGKYSLHSNSVSDNSYSSSKIDSGKRESSCENSDFILKPAIEFKPCQVLLTKVDYPSFENVLPVKSETTGEPSLNEGEHKLSQSDEESSCYLRANLFEESDESDEENIEIIYSTFEQVETRSSADKDNIYSQNSTSGCTIKNENSLESRESEKENNSPLNKQRKSSIVVEKEDSSSKFVDRDPKLLPAAQKEGTFSRNGIKRKASVENDLFRKMEHGIGQQSSESENEDDTPKKRKMTVFQRKGTLVDNIELKKNEKTKDNFSKDSVKTRKRKSSGNSAGLSQKSDERVNEIEDEICQESGSSEADDEDNLLNEPQNKKSKLMEQSSPSSHSSERKMCPKMRPKNRTDSQKTSGKRFEFHKNLDLSIFKKGVRLSSSQGSSPEYDSSERDELFQKLLSCPSTSGCEEPKPSTSAVETSKPKKIQQISMSECCEFQIKNDDHSPDEISIVKNNVKSPESEEILSDEDEIPCEVVEIEDNMSQSDKDESAYESASDSSSGEDDRNLANVYDNLANHSKFIHDSPETPSCSYAPDQPSTSQDIDESWDRYRLSNRFGLLTPIESSSADPGNICKFRTKNGNLYKVDYFEYGNIKKLYVHLDISGQKQQFSPCKQCKKNRIRREKHVSTKFHSLGAYNKKHDVHPQYDDLSDNDEDYDQTVPELNLSSDYGYCKSALLSDSSDSEEDHSDDSGMEKGNSEDLEEESEQHRTKRTHKPETDNDDSNDSLTMNSDYYCVHCGFKFLNKKENYHHTCGGKPRKGFLCMYCERIFPTYDQLSNHKKMHTG